MIQAFVGLVGGGKSFCSVRRMCSYMALGGRVVSNIRLTGYDDKSGDLLPDSATVSFLRDLGWQYQPHQYVYIAFDEMTTNPEWWKKIPSGVDRDHRNLCVIDEATDLFDSLDANKIRQDSCYRGLFHFLRLSRHAHVDVLFICQDIDSINSRLRGLVANVWRSTDMRNFIIHGFKIPFPFDVFCLQLFDRKGKYELKREWVRKDTRIFQLYESEVFGGSLGVKWDGVAIGNGKIKEDKKMSRSQYFGLLFVIVSVFLVDRYIPREEKNLPNDDSSVELPPRPSVMRSVEISPAVGTNDVAVVSRPSRRVVRANLRFLSFNGDRILYVDDKVVRKGFPCEWGIVEVLNEKGMVCRSDDGSLTFVLPRTPHAATF